MNNHDIGSKDYFIRPIEKKEVKEVYQMLLSLTKHEKIHTRLKLTEETMSDFLFHNTPDWFCLVVEDTRNHTLKGFVSYTFANINRAFHTSPLVYIDHLYIDPNYRNQKIGKILIQTLISHVKSKGIERLELWCMRSNEIGNNFYKKIGAQLIDFVNIYRINLL